MMRALAVCALTVALCSTGSSRTSAQGDNRPGQPTASRVEILNRAPAEAVAVRVFNDGTGAVPTTIVGVPTVTLANGVVVATRPARQPWEYRRVLVAAGADPTETLNAAGLEGWDAVGVVPASTGQTAVLLKRPR